MAIRPDGEFRIVTDVVFDPNGKRSEQVVFAPQSTLERISMTKEDMDDIQHRSAVRADHGRDS